MSDLETRSRRRAGAAAPTDADRRRPLAEAELAHAPDATEATEEPDASTRPRPTSADHDGQNGHDGPSAADARRGGGRAGRGGPDDRRALHRRRPCARPASATRSPCPGESFLGLLDALGDAGIRVVATRHEGAAAFMAEAHGQLTGRPAACLGDPGRRRRRTSRSASTRPARTRARCSPSSARSSAAYRGREAFQEIDQVATLGGLAKWAAEPTTADEVPDVLAEAVRAGARRTARAGPALAARGPPRRGGPS